MVPEVNEGESRAFCPSANENNNGCCINTTNHHPDESPNIGGVTYHHEKLLQAQNFGVQEVTDLTKENISTSTQRTLAEDGVNVCTIVRRGSFEDLGGGGEGDDDGL